MGEQVLVGQMSSCQGRKTPACFSSSKLNVPDALLYDDLHLNKLGGTGQVSRPANLQLTRLCAQTLGKHP